MAELDVARFYARLGKVHAAFVRGRNGPLWSSCSCLSLTRGVLSESDPYRKSVVLHHYLFGYELPDTLVLLTVEGECYVLTTKKKSEFLQPAVGAAPPGSSIVSVTILQRNKEDGNAANFTKLFDDVLRGGTNGNSKTKTKVGVFMKEWNADVWGEGDTIAAGWGKKLNEAKEEVELVDVGPGVSYVMAIKDESELDLMKKSSVLSNKVLKHGFIPRIEEVIDSELSVKHEQLATEVEAIIEDPSKINLKVPKEHVQPCYFPIIQSGGQHDIKISAQSNDSTLKYDIVTVSLGARYQLYCSNISRTFLVDPPKAVSDTYETLLAMQEACLKVMRPGQVFRDVYGAAINYLKRSKRSDLVGKLPKNVGFSVGLDFRDGTLTLSSKNTTPLKRGMVFTLSVGFSDVELNSKDKGSVNDKSAIKAVDKYGMIIADMVTVTESGGEILTKHSKALSDVSYTLNDDEDDEDETSGGKKGSSSANSDEALARKLAKEESAAAASEGENEGRRAGSKRISARLASNNASAIQELHESKADRERRQIELMARRNEDRLRELARGNRNRGENGESEKAMELETYKRSKEYPDNVVPNQVKVDMVNKCVILPICGNPVPFHISTIKHVVLPDPDAATYLRINFYTAGMAVGKDAPANMAKLIQKYAPYASFIREMTFRSLDSHGLTQAYRQISELRKRERQLELREQEEANLVKQEKLVRTKNERVPRLVDLTMRPVFTFKKTQGSLDAHTNGFRFMSQRGEVVDIMYANIKHAIFQPCENEIMVLIHFHLRDPIMVGKKKQKDIQYFTEVVDASQAVDGSRRGFYDQDELDDEQRERMLRKKLNEAFKEFCRKAENVAKKNNYTLEFDIPYRDLGFEGNPHKEMVTIVPTLNCIINVTETPFFVVDLSDIDHVHFERVTFMSKAFDMVLINKDFTKQPFRVDMIASSDKDSIQEWLTDMELSYTEGPMNLNWKSIMGTVAGDERFYMNTEEDEVTEKEAGWEFLRMYGRNDESDNEGEDDEDEEFVGDAGEESEESDSEESDDFDSEEDDEDDYDADEDLEEQGMDWDDMEREAAADDRRRHTKGQEEDSDNDRRSKRRRGSSGGGGGGGGDRDRDRRRGRGGGGGGGGSAKKKSRR